MLYLDALIYIWICSPVPVCEYVMHTNAGVNLRFSLLIGKVSPHDPLELLYVSSRSLLWLKDLFVVVC